MSLLRKTEQVQSGLSEQQRRWEEVEVRLSQRGAELSETQRQLGEVHRHTVELNETLSRISNTLAYRFYKRVRTWFEGVRNLFLYKKVNS